MCILKQRSYCLLPGRMRRGSCSRRRARRRGPRRGTPCTTRRSTCRSASAAPLPTMACMAEQSVGQSDGKVKKKQKKSSHLPRSEDATRGDLPVQRSDSHVRLQSCARKSSGRMVSGGAGRVRVIVNIVNNRTESASPPKKKLAAASGGSATTARISRRRRRGRSRRRRCSRRRGPPASSRLQQPMLASPCAELGDGWLLAGCTERAAV
jgi:hypothetical protein